MHSFKRVGALLVPIISLAVLSWGQTSQGTIAGSVLDSSGAAIANAEVTAKNTLGAETRVAKTGSNGEYRFDAITPSNYSLVVTASGFRKQEIKGLRVQASVVTSQNISLEVGTIEQTDGLGRSFRRAHSDRKWRAEPNHFGRRNRQVTDQ